MTITDLNKITKCHIYIERSNNSGVDWRYEWTGQDGDWEVKNIKIIHAETPEYIGFALCVELEEGA